MISREIFPDNHYYRHSYNLAYGNIAHIYTKIANKVLQYHTAHKSCMIHAEREVVLIICMGTFLCTHKPDFLMPAVDEHTLLRI